jgi:hypothetical protein
VDGWHGYTGLKTQTLLVVASGAAGLLEMLFVCAVDRCPHPDKGRYLRIPNVLADAGQGIVLGSNLEKGREGSGYLIKQPQVVAVNRLADEPVKAKGWKVVNSHYWSVLSPTK